MIDHYGLAVPLPLAAHGSTSMTSRAVPSGRRPAVGRVIRMRDAKGYNFGDGRGARLLHFVASWAGEEHFCVRNHHGPGAILLTASALIVAGRRDTNPRRLRQRAFPCRPSNCPSGAVPYSPTTDADGPRPSPKL